MQNLSTHLLILYFIFLDMFLIFPVLVFLLVSGSLGHPDRARVEKRITRNLFNGDFWKAMDGLNGMMDQMMKDNPNLSTGDMLKLINKPGVA